MTIKTYCKCNVSSSTSDRFWRQWCKNAVRARDTCSYPFYRLI